jgi:hypothetical protein
MGTSVASSDYKYPGGRRSRGAEPPSPGRRGLLQAPQAGERACGAAGLSETGLRGGGAGYSAAFIRKPFSIMSDGATGYSPEKQASQ